MIGIENIVLTYLILTISSTMLESGGWMQQKFKQISDIGWCFPSGSLLSKANINEEIGKTFDFLWDGVIEHIIETTNAREKTTWTKADIALYLASILVMGLTPSPTIDGYWKDDPMGILGSTWLQKHFTRDKWHNMNAHIHFDPKKLCDLLNANFKKAYIPEQVLCVDEMMIPFDGRWKWIQHVRGKPHNTGMCNN